MLYIISFIICIVLIFGVYLFNRLVKQNQMVKEAWSGIDVQLKRRSDLIPSLVEVVKSYATHEKKLLKDITEMRAQSVQAHDEKADIAGRNVLEKNLAGNIGKLFMVVENYPDLKADKNFLELQNSLIDIEDTLQMARRYYNGSVRDCNILVESFPSNIIANVFDYQTQLFFEISNPLEKLNVTVEIS